MPKNRSRRTAAPTGTADQRDEPRALGPFPIVGVGASAGGLEAFSELLKHLPLDTGMGFVFVQHLDPQHESALTQLLGRVTRVPVCEVTNELRVEPNHVYVIPPNTAMGIAGGVLTLRPRQQNRTPSRSIDIFFEALAADQRERAIGVVLSGAATDGTLGLEAIKAEGGITFAQDESAKYDSMPRSAVAAGCVDFVLSPEQIATELARIATHPALGPRPRAPATAVETDRTGSTGARDDADPGGPVPRDPGFAEDGFKRILLLLHRHAGVDFSLYKSSTIQRRILRRMVLNKHDTLERYAQFLRGNAQELAALYADALISVTSFFRNPDAFDVIQRAVWPTLLRQGGDDPIRAWVLGCSTGQEAYSLCMSFVEGADKALRMRKLQVFATDLNEALLDQARHGLYAKTVVQDLSPDRLRRFFVEEDGGYRVAKSLREMVVFARQNVIGDPPFSRMDLISCRNLLIYFEPSLQKKVFPLFHYALKSGGFLYLGASESVGGFTDLFEPVDKKHKIFTKKAAPTPPFQRPARKERGQPPSPGSRRAPLHGGPQGDGLPPPMQAGQGAVDGYRAEIDAQREADRVTVHQFAPPAVLINAGLQILQFRGPTSAYLDPPTGKASFDVLKMARSGLMLPLRAAITKAKKNHQTARKERVRIEQDGTTRLVNLEVIPLKNLREPCFLIVFEDADTAGRAARRSPEPAARVDRTPRGGESRRRAELETELTETRDFMQSIQEQHEAANEELQASNEEVQSANEELQSLNEELETSKEELESANEELATVNAEMTHRNTDLGRLNGDLATSRDYAEAIIRTTRDPLLILKADLRVETANRAFYTTFNVSPEDSEGRLVYDLGHGQWNIPQLRRFLDATLSDGRVFDDFEVTGDFEGLGRRTMLVNGRRLSDSAGQPARILLGIQDATGVASVQSELRDSEERYRTLFASAPMAVFVCDRNAVIQHYNRRAVELWGREPVAGREKHCGSVKLWLPDGARLPHEQSPIVEVLRTGVPARNVYVLIERPDGSRLPVLANFSAVRNARGEITSAITSFMDITERIQAEEALRESDRHKNEFLATLAHELRNPLAPMRNSIEIIRRTRRAEAPTARTPAPPGGEGLAGMTASHVLDTAVDVLERQVGQMVRLVDDLLDVGRISSGKMELRRERVELSSVVYHAADAARSLFERMGHELSVSVPREPVYVNADPARLAQIVGNLLNNACKFTDPGGRIGLTVEREAESRADDLDGASRRHAPDVVIRVRDTGIGIAADQLPRVFDMFAQVDISLGRSMNGLGIGLTLVKTLAQMHGGTAEVTSAGVGRGSEFSVCLPTIDAPLPVSGSVTTAPAVIPPLRILVVDDNRDSAESLATLLQLSGHEAHMAHDGLTAVESAAGLEPDLILLDIGLPGLNGYEAGKRIRAQHHAKRPMLVALTGWGQPEDRRRSLEAGFDAHLVKPVDDVALMKLLEQLGGGCDPIL